MAIPPRWGGKYRGYNFLSIFHPYGVALPRHLPWADRLECPPKYGRTACPDSFYRTFPSLPLHSLSNFTCRQTGVPTKKNHGNVKIKKRASKSYPLFQILQYNATHSSDSLPILLPQIQPLAVVAKVQNGKLYRLFEFRL